MFKELSKEVSKVTLNPHLRWVFVLLLIMYVFSLDQLVTREGNALLKSTGAKLIVMLLVVLLADRDPFMAVLLAVAYLVSLHSLPFLEGMDNKSDDPDHSDDNKKKLAEYTAIQDFLSKKGNFDKLTKFMKDKKQTPGLLDLVKMDDPDLLKKKE